MKKFGLFDRFRIPTYNDPRQMEYGIVEIDPEKCTGCTLCVGACPAKTLFMKDKKALAKKVPVNECAFCGDCVAICAAGAISMKKPYKFSGFFKPIDEGEPSPPRL